tara:strand:+ start:567 stop:1238 length:672 start_codon:yes stop_codon:yes gene_type:complete
MQFRNIEIEAYMNFINSDSVVYDIGAHTGETCKIFDKYSPKKIYAFEPNELNFNELKENTKNISNLEYFKLALSDDSFSCNTRFRDCRTDRDESNPEQYIEYATIDSVSEKHSLLEPSFIKIDIEGMESKVLTTFNTIFENSRPFIYVEIHAAARGSTHENYEKCPHWVWPEDGGFDFNSLKDLDYQIFSEKDGLLNIEKDWDPSENDHMGYILTPKEKISYK